MKNNPIFLTGGSGFVGATVLKELLANEYSNIYATYLHHRGPEAKGVQWIQLDLTNPTELENFLPQEASILHLAGKVSYLKKDRANLYKNNVEVAKNLVHASLEKNAKQVIFLSTASTLIKNNNPLFVSERAEGQSLFSSVYSQTKHLAELEFWRGAAEGLKIKIFNPAFIIGEGSWNKGSMSVFAKVEKGLRFYSTGNLGLIDVWDVAHILLESIVNQDFDTQQILVAETWTWRDFLNEIAGQLGKTPIPYSTGPFINFILNNFANLVTDNIYSKETIRISNLNLAYDVENNIFHKTNYPFRNIRSSISELVKNRKPN